MGAGIWTVEEDEADNEEPAFLDDVERSPSATR